jgi:hypothetical protein
MRHHSLTRLTIRLNAGVRMTETLDALRQGRLAGATELRLKAGLTEFPSELFGLADTLEVLDLGGNALTSLPDDLSRLRKLRVLFCSFNPFRRLPPSLGDCAELSQIGFRGAGMREIPGEALPPKLRWLTLTDNQIATLPDAIGQRPALQKLMLSGNQLRALPGTLANAPNLELLRLSANRFDSLPDWITALPRLAWLAFAGNPFDQDRGAPAAAAVDWRDLQPGARLGEGASGLVHHAVWRKPGAPPREAALKLFKGAMTSDGLPEREMEACLSAGEHPNLMSGLGRVTGHPDGLQGLLMPLLPPDWRVLAGPPSPASCSRDVYDPALQMTSGAALRIAQGIGAAIAHLHARGVMHGDLYAHNILWDGTAGAAVLSDFGAACLLPGGAAGAALQRLEVLAWGILLGELLAYCPDAPRGLQDLHRSCTHPDPAARPSMAEACEQLDLAAPALHL